LAEHGSLRGAESKEGQLLKESRFDMVEELDWEEPIGEYSN